MGKSLIRMGVVLSVAILAGRITGFLREIVLASHFGATAQADAAVLVLTLPDLLVNLLLAGGLAGALVPEFKSLDKTRAANLFVQSSLVIGGLFGILALLIASFPIQVLGLLGPGLVAQAYDDGAVAMRIMAWAIPLSALAGTTTAYLQANERFLSSGLGTLIFNTCIIAVLLIPGMNTSLIVALALAINAGAFFRWAAQLANIPRERPRNIWADWLINRALLTRYFQALLSSSILLAVPVLARAYASASGEGGVAIFNYASKLVELPLSVFITLIASITFPRLSKHFTASIRSPEGYVLLGQALRLTILLSVSITLICAWYALPLASLVYGQSGSLSGPELDDLGTLAGIGFLSLPLQGACYMLATALNAQKRTHVPMWISGLCVGAMAIAMAWFAGDLAVGSVMLILNATYAVMTVCLWIATGPKLWGNNGVFDSRVVLAIVLSSAVFAMLATIQTYLSLPHWMLLGWIALAGLAVLAVNLGVGIPNLKSLVRR